MNIKRFGVQFAFRFEVALKLIPCFVVFATISKVNYETNIPATI